MWTAKIIKVEADSMEGTANVTYEYTSDDSRKLSIVEKISDASSIKRIAVMGIAELERKDSIASLIANPPIGEVDTKPEVNPGTNYQKKRSALIMAKQDLEIGLISNEQYQTILTDVKNSA